VQQSQHAICRAQTTANLLCQTSPLHHKMPLQLYVWGPAFDVPSIDPSCLALEAYLRVTNADFTVVHANDPQLSPTGKCLPDNLGNGRKELC
jgi:hypothetical protein